MSGAGKARATRTRPDPTPTPTPRPTPAGQTFAQAAVCHETQPHFRDAADRDLHHPLGGHAVAFGCRSLAGLNIVNPRYALRGVVPHVAIALPLSQSAIDLDFNIEVDNPNPVGLRLDWLDFDLAVNERRC